MEASLLYVFALCIGVTSLTAAVFFAVEIGRLRSEKGRLLRELEKKGDRLRSTEASRDTLLSAALLDMPGQVAAIEGYAKRLLDEEGGKLPQKVIPTVEKIARTARTLSSTLVSARTPTRP